MLTVVQREAEKEFALRDVPDNGTSRLLSPFDEWRHSHAVALAAWCIEQLPAQDERHQIALEWLDSGLHWSSARRVAGGDEEEIGCPLFPPAEGVVRRIEMNTLSAYALKMLSRLAERQDTLPAALAKFVMIAKEAHAEISEPRVRFKKKRPSVERGSRLMANAIIAGMAPIDGLLRTGSAVVASRWADLSPDDPFICALSEGLTTLRAFPGDVRTKLITLARIRQSLNDSLASLGLRRNWIFIEYNILNSLVAWPLLVDTHRTGTASIGLSLPVFLSVNFSAGTTEPQVFGDPNGRLKCNWSTSIKAASDAAHDLWRKECGHFGQDWIRRVRRHAAVVVDFAPAEAVLAEVKLGNFAADNFQFVVEGRSIELYFALASFAHLRGLHYPLSACATGAIENPAYHLIEFGSRGRRKTIGQLSLMDRLAKAPEGLSEKVRWLDASIMFDKFILPNDASPESETKKATSIEAKRLQTYLSRNLTRHVEINYCAKLSNAADSAFANDWRRSRAVRNPGLDTSEDGDIVDTSESYMEVLEALADVQPVKMMPGVTVNDVTKAVRLLNWRREELAANKAARSIPPMLSALFVRLIEDEGGDRLCGMLAEAVHAPSQLIELLMAAVNDQERAQILAEIFNHTNPDVSTPGWRAPDLIVFSLPRSVLESIQGGAFERGDLSRDWAHVLAPILDPKLAVLLKRVVDPRWGKTIGNVRMIFACSDDQADALTYDKAGLACGHGSFSPEISTAIEALSTFRFEFSQQEATLLLQELDLGRGETRDLLHSLESIGVVQATRGRWMVVEAMRQIDQKVTPMLAFRRHIAAALARAPSLLATRVAGLADFEARKLYNVHEAQFHLNRAIELHPTASRCGNTKQTLSALRAWQVRLRITSDVIGWDVVHEAASNDSSISAKTGLEVSERLLERLVVCGNAIKMEHSIAMIRLITRRLREIDIEKRQNVAIKEERLRLTDQSLRIAALHLVPCYCFDSRKALPDFGLASLPDLQSSDENTIAQYVVLLSVLVTHELGLTTAQMATFDAWLRSATSVSSKAKARAAGAWFEKQGDSIDDEAEAIKWYQDGYRTSAYYTSNWIKAMACAGESDGTLDCVTAELCAFAKAEPRRFRSMVKFLMLSQTQIGKGHDDRRWRLGAQKAIEVMTCSAGMLSILGVSQFSEETGMGRSRF